MSPVFLFSMFYSAKRFTLRYYTPPILSRFPIIRLYCYSFPSSFYSNLFGQSWIGLPVNVPGSGCHGSTPRVLVASLDQTLTEDLLPFLVLHLSLVFMMLHQFLKLTGRLEQFTCEMFRGPDVHQFTSRVLVASWKQTIVFTIHTSIVYSPLMLYFDRYMSQLNFGTKIILI